jgi:hypothetical protein
VSLISWLAASLIVSRMVSLIFFSFLVLFWFYFCCFAVQGLYWRSIETIARLCAHLCNTSVILAG